MIPERSILLLEDIDAAFKNNRTSEQANFVTFSGLLNALDGVASSEERVVFMTTNHIERLDPALIRPGRVDVKYYLGFASQSQMSKMFVQFYSGEYSLAQKFSSTLSKAKISPAQIQGHFIKHKNSAQEAVNFAHSLNSTIALRQ